MIKIGQIFDELDEIVAEYGADTKYEDRLRLLAGDEVAEAFNNGLAISGCTYTVNGAPACIIGVWLDKHGIRVPEDGRYNDVAWSVYPDGVAKEFGAPAMTQDASKVLRAVQNKQDLGVTWGEAVREAKVAFGYFK